MKDTHLIVFLDTETAETTTLLSLEGGAFTAESLLASIAAADLYVEQSTGDYDPEAWPIDSKVLFFVEDPMHDIASFVIKESCDIHGTVRYLTGSVYKNHRREGEPGRFL